MNKVPFAAAFLSIAPACDGKLVFTRRDRKLIDRKSCDRQGDSDSPLAAILNVVRRIAFRRDPARPLKKRAGVLKAEQKRVIEERRAIHVRAL